MPIASAPSIPVPPNPAVPQAVPPAQRVTPVEPAKRVTRSKEGRRAADDPEDQRGRAGERGGLYDLEA